MTLPPASKLFLAEPERKSLKAISLHSNSNCHSRHRHQEFLSFLERIDAAVATDFEIHLVLDYYGAHKHPEVNRWLADWPRCLVHLTPTSSPWLNQIERGLIQAS